MENSILFRTTDILSEKRCFGETETRSQKCTRMYTFGADAPFISKGESTSFLV